MKSAITFHKMRVGKEHLITLCYYVMKFIARRIYYVLCMLKVINWKVAFIILYALLIFKKKGLWCQKKRHKRTENRV